MDMESYGQQLGCFIFGLVVLAVLGWVAAIVLGSLIVAGVL